ncbi:cupin domain-containing protein [Mitsuokella multacida]|uniref:cupin domain-containing protein n=1 Tax=Mitsuokella multacida TaxID=52226 RepID=UPI0026DAD2E5|nr:cupin domain-containing protein [Mitsuokella multacida]
MNIRNVIPKVAKGLVASALLASTALSVPTCLAADLNVKNAQTETEITQALMQEGGAVYPIGQPNTGYAKYFTGRSFLFPMQGKGVNVANVTFEPGCINFWHKHHGSCQVLAGVSGKGYYQIWGEEPKELLPGESITIPENVKHWHGAQHTSWFQHLSIMKEGASTEWLEPVSEAEYAKLK